MTKSMLMKTQNTHPMRRPSSDMMISYYTIGSQKKEKEKGAKIRFQAIKEVILIICSCEEEVFMTFVVDGQ
jgi:hypothetical protein